MKGKIPTQLGKFKLLKSLGTGGMAEVFLAFDDNLGREVALKVLSAGADAKATRDFLQEARRIAQLSDHQNIVTVHEAGEDQGHVYIAMRKMDGGTLHELLAARSVQDLETLRRVVSSIGGALQHAHDHNVVHCDVKPKNILLDGRDGFYLADFGISRMTWDALAGNGDPSTGLTVRYASPEQLQDLPADAASDLYSLALIVYRMCTGRLPYEGATSLDQQRDMVLKEPLPDPRSFNDRVPDGLADSLHKALSLDPAARQGSVMEFVREILQHTRRQGNAGGGKMQVNPDDETTPVVVPVPNPVPNPVPVPDPSPVPDPAPAPPPKRRAIGIAVVAIAVVAVIFLVSQSGREPGPAQPGLRMRDGIETLSGQLPRPFQVPADEVSVQFVLQSWTRAWHPGLRRFAGAAADKLTEKGYRVPDPVQLVEKAEQDSAAFQRVRSAATTELLLRILLQGHVSRQFEGTHRAAASEFGVELWSTVNDKRIWSFTVPVAPDAPGDAELTESGAIDKKLDALLAGLPEAVLQAVAAHHKDIEENGRLFDVVIHDPFADAAFGARFENDVKSSKQAIIVGVGSGQDASAAGATLAPVNLRVIASPPSRSKDWTQAIEQHAGLSLASIESFDAADPAIPQLLEHLARDPSSAGRWVVLYFDDADRASAARIARSLSLLQTEDAAITAIFRRGAAAAAIPSGQLVLVIPERITADAAGDQAERPAAAGNDPGQGQVLHYSIRYRGTQPELLQEIRNWLTRSLGSLRSVRIDTNPRSSSGSRVIVFDVFLPQ
jgi:serine/threonine protein kinase